MNHSTQVTLKNENTSEMNELHDTVQAEKKVDKWKKEDEVHGILKSRTKQW